ncbi:engulfment and cell motility protein 1-like [Babylonia areolata]|uniref:engulfment and cell motility protein 1-like n=1 Tax=Babylonia areolata TaxID=304850 RepID=UPI003FD462DE
MSSTQVRTLPTTPKSQLPSLNANIRKVAVTMPGYQAQFLEFDQKRPLAAIIQDICASWTLNDASKFALQISDSSKNNTYITERNRHEIQNGAVLSLSPSPAQTAQSIICKLSQGSNKTLSEEKLDGLRQLVSLAPDSTFAVEFINKNGLPIIIAIVTDGTFKKEPLQLTLRSFVALMDHGIVSWDILEPEFVKRVADCVNVGSNNLDVVCLQASLEILESVVLHSTGKQNVVEQSVTSQNIIPHLESINLEVQKNAIALINALFMKADVQKRKKIADSLQSKHVRTTILTHVIRLQNIGTAMAHQLYVLQVLLLNLHEERMKAPVDPHDQVIMKEIEELRRTAFEIEVDPNMNAVRRSQSAARDFKKLGFENQANPAEDFVKVPSSLLALDCMLYFAKNHGENYVKMVLENSTRADEHDVPFVKASMYLTKMICEILKIGEQPDDTGSTYYPMFFASEKPLEEFYCIVVQLLNKTWREMRATIADFPKVLEVVKEQVTRVLVLQPSSFESFRTKVFTLTYSDILKLLENERKIKEEFESQTRPVVELRKKLVPDIQSVVRQQRLNYLMEGTCFPKYHCRNGRIKDKFWFWRLSPNLKSLHYGDCSESDHPKLEDLPSKLPVVDIQRLVTGKDCPHVGGRGVVRRGNQGSRLAFSIVTEAEEDQICFIAGAEYEYDMWCDGLNALLGNEMGSGRVEQDMEMLLSMEIKIRLLDTEGLQIPADPPPLPPEPDNFNFAYMNLL